MVFASIFIAYGLTIQFYGMTNDFNLISVIGTVMYIIGLIAGVQTESKLNDRIEALEKEIKEMKTNDERNSM